MRTRYSIFGILLLLLVLSARGQVNSSYYYYYKGEKVYLDLNTSYAYVAYPKDQALSMSSVRRVFGPGVKITEAEEDMTANTLKQVDNNRASDMGALWSEVALPATRAQGQYLNALAPLRRTGAYVAPYFKTQQTEKIGLSQYFYVKLRREGDLSILKEMADRYGIVITGQNKFMHLWYTLDCMGSSLDALQAANRFYDSGKFQHAEPDLMTDDLVEEAILFPKSGNALSSMGRSDDGAVPRWDAFLAPNDPFYGDQWGLDNTGQNGGTPGIDIHAEEAWDITTGSSDVIVAVLDHGFEMDHPDLAVNTVGQGFDTESGTTPSRVLGAHGTACAGIVGAVQNDLGVSGVAPNTGLVSISNSFLSTPNSRQRRADGINWAVQNGTDVISNSWGSGVQYQIIDDAITNALQNGRDGLGTVVVFATGNNNGNVIYPANSNPDILAVGAMSPCGERKSPTSCDGENWGSNFGNTLDVVAPGVSIPTTDRRGDVPDIDRDPNNPGDYNLWAFSPPNNYRNLDYTRWFNGTSSACPHVAGVAALILSVNPDLNVQQINDIIEQSAQKVRTDLYDYENANGRPNGTWNDQMGYGLVDAHAAVLLAQSHGCSNHLAITQDVPAGSTDNRQAGNTLTATNTITAGASASYSAGTTVTLSPGFKALQGSYFHGLIEACNSGSASRLMEPVAAVEDVGTADTTEVLTSKAMAIPQGLEVFPNPTKGRIDIFYAFMAERRYTAMIYDITGRPLLQQEMSAKDNVMDLRGFTPGIYLLRFSDSEEQEVFTQKIVLE